VSVDSLFVSVDSFIHSLCDVTHLYVRHHSFICVTRLMHVCGMTHSEYGAIHLYVRGDSREHSMLRIECLWRASLRSFDRMHSLHSLSGALLVEGILSKGNTLENTLCCV